MALEKELNELWKCIEAGAREKHSVSTKNTFWHIDHSMRVVSGVVNLLNKEKEPAPRQKINWSRIYVFTTGKIPRGAAKAPAGVVSNGEVTIASLEKRKRNIRFALRLLDKIPDDACFDHLYLGQLNKRNAIRFMKIHTRHHLKIIRDILD